MAITDRDVVDSVAYEDSILLLQLYDHLDFEGEFEKDHMLMLQDKLNTYIWYIDSKQYQTTYPGKDFKKFHVKIFSGSTRATKTRRRLRTCPTLIS